MVPEADGVARRPDYARRRGRSSGFIHGTVNTAIQLCWIAGSSMAQPTPWISKSYFLDRCPMVSMASCISFSVSVTSGGDASACATCLIHEMTDLRGHGGQLG